MNKKFLSAILFGALMVTSTGTFVSCKDYDEDIENLQEQINKLATKEDMASQIATLQSALSAAQGEAAAAKTTAAQALDKANSIAATATEAEKAAAEASKAAAQAALDAAAAKEEAIAAAKEEVAKAQEALEEAIATNFEAVKEQLAKQIAGLTEDVEALTGYTTEMVTDINLENNKDFDTTLELNYAKVKAIVYPKGLKIEGSTPWVTAETYEFGKGMPGAFVVNKGDINTVQDDLLINVAPVNAAIPSESLSLINSKGESLNDYVDIKIANYDGLLTSRSAASTGLRQVGVQLKNTVDFEKFDKLVIKGETDHSTVNGDNEEYNCVAAHNFILHALAATDAKGRSVNSEFKVNLHVQKELPAYNIVSNSMLSSSAYVGASPIINHLEALDGSKEYPSFPIVVNETFTLEVGSDYPTKGGRVMASYVELDPENPALSETDKKALKLITVSGDKNVVKNGVHKLIVGGDAEGMPVPFKLVTIDYQGTVQVFPFWVKAETPALLSATFTVTPATYVKEPENWAQKSTKEEFTVPANAATFTIDLTIGETAHQTPKVYKMNNVSISNITTYFNLYKGNKTSVATAMSDVAYAEFKAAVNLQVMREDKAYEGVIKFYASNGSYLGSNAISVKKVLPTAIKSGLSAKENAINNGVLTVYPLPVKEKPGTAVFALSNAFNFENNLAGDSFLSFNTPAFENADGTYKAYYNTAERMIAINNVNIIDGTTTFPTTVTYNYGDIKYHAEGHGVECPEEYVVTWDTEFAVKFSCYPVDCTFSWYNTPAVYYKEAVTLDGHVRKADGSIDKARNVIKTLDPYAKEIDAFSNVAPWNSWSKSLKECTIQLWTNGDKTKVNEFFIPTWVSDNGKTSIRLEPTSADVVLSGDVEITVVFFIDDMFGHKPAHEVKALTFTMKKDHVVAE